MSGAGQPVVPELLVIVGPTASGKTALGVALGQRLRGEVISADSCQVYRHFDIGTAKPTLAEREGIVHHLLDLAEPTEQLSAGTFARHADAVIGDIRARGRLPIVVGGTGLWIRALLYGLPPLPETPPALRSELQERLAMEGLPLMAEELRALDPDLMVGLDAKNPVRVLRALELHRLTGEKPSVLRARHRFVRPRYAARLLGIEPPRDELHARIERRTRAMFETGLLDEVRRLLDAGWGSAPAFQAIGYPQARAVLEGTMTLDAAIEDTARETRRYAKRQRTWFTAEAGVEWLGWPVSVETALTRATAPLKPGSVQGRTVTLRNEDEQ